MKDIVMMIVCFCFGYAVSIYVNKKKISQTKNVTKYVNILMSKKYKKGLGDGRG